MINRYINNTNFNVDNFLNGDWWIYKLTINDYKVVVICWNLLLLFVPYFLCNLIIKYWHQNKFKKFYQKILALGLGFIWLLFIPNTAYIITDIRHLLNYCPLDSPHKVCPENVWMIIFFFFYASFGWVAYVYLVNQMKEFLAKAWGRKISLLYTWLVIPFISLGVLLGLINRWNSWEFFIYPINLFKNVSVYFTSLDYFINWLIFTIFLYILYWGGNLVMNNAPPGGTGKMQNE